ncbi:MFS transporter [Rhodoferax sp.]|uniref:MFS transporter n=1 Tax=Rhodoferax sp. TaxID=50421 RepID=UPI00374CE225
MKLKDFIARIPYLAWVVIYTAFCAGIFAAILGTVTPELREELDNYQQMGILMMVWSAGGVLGALQGGRMAQRYAPRPLFLTYTCMALLSVSLIVWSPNFAVLLAGFFLVALCETALFTLAHSILANISPQAEVRARMLSMVDVAFSLGNLVSPMAVIGVQQFSHNWRTPYAVYLLPLLTVLAAFWPRRHFESLAPVQHAASPEGKSMGYLQLLQRPVVFWAVLGGVLSGFLEWGQNFWYVSFGIDAQQLAPNTARMGLEFFVAGMIVARLWQAFWHSSWPLRQKLWRLNLLALTGMAMNVALAGHGGWMLAGLGNFLFGVGVGVVFPVLLAIMIDSMPAQASKLSALLMIGYSIGSQLAGLVVGSLSDVVGVHWAYASLLLVVVAFTGVVWRIAGFPAPPVLQPQAVKNL